MVYSKVKTKATWRKWAVSWKYFLIGSMIHPRAEGVDAGDTQGPTSTAPWAEAAEGTSHRMNLILWSLLGESFFITVTPTQGCSGQSLHRAISWRTCIITSSLPRYPETSRKCFLTVNPTFSCGRLNSLLLDFLQKRWRSTGRYSQDNFSPYQTSLFLYISSFQTFYWRPQRAFVMWVISRGI